MFITSTSWQQEVGPFLVDRRRDVEGLLYRLAAAKCVVELFGEGARGPVAQACARPHADDVWDAGPRTGQSRGVVIVFVWLSSVASHRTVSCL